MKGKWAMMGSIVAVAVLALAAGLTQAQGPESPGEGAPPQGEAGIEAVMSTAFTYQGYLKKDGLPYDGTCDFIFNLYGVESGGSPIQTLGKANVSVSQGLFTIPDLDFPGSFRGEARWLEILVRCPAGSGVHTTLSPRQPLTAAPYALALPGLWTRPNATSPNLIGGYSGNSVTSGVVGATVGGGGASGKLNRVTDDYGTIGGGSNNTAGDDDGTLNNRTHATVGGGSTNTASGLMATVGGGGSNTASGERATIGGGFVNMASGSIATVGGGGSNTASGEAATIGGGSYNTAAASYATIAGGGPSDPNNPQATSNRVTDNYGAIGGGGYNQAGDGAGTVEDRMYATVGGGYQNTASGSIATVGGGGNNSASGYAATVGGGGNNTASGYGATVGGGYLNAASDSFATVGGGDSNSASGEATTVTGGRGNSASGDLATVGGGYVNTASGLYATIPGGYAAKATHYGEMAYASGKLANDGDAQTSLYVMRIERTCTAGVWYDLYLNGNDTPSTFLTVAPGRTLAFDALVVGRTQGGESAGYYIRGVVENVAGTVAFIGTPSVTILGEDDSVWNVQAVASDALDALFIQVQGNNETIRWVATVRTVEVAW